MTDSLAVEMLALGPYQTNCYILSAGNKAIIIDPGDEADLILATLREKNLTAEKIILTHGHIDHIGAVGDVKKATGVPVLIHEKDAVMLTEASANLSAFHGEPFTTDAADGFLEDGDMIELGSYSLKVLHTPGHTPGGISLHVDNILFSGDALFWGSVGRTDFPNGSHELLIDSIRSKLMSLPDDTVVYPGHGPETTIGQEREINPFLI